MIAITNVEMYLINTHVPHVSRGTFKKKKKVYSFMMREHKVTTQDSFQVFIKKKFKKKEEEDSFQVNNYNLFLVNSN